MSNDSNIRYPRELTSARSAPLARTIRAGLVYGVLVVASLASMPTMSKADEGGVSFWVPGLFGSLAATPQQPGFSFTAINYYTNVSAGADVATARQVSRGNITANVTANLTGNLHADAELGFAIPSYVFATPVLGGQAAIALLVPFGRSNANVDATLTGAVGPFPFTVSGGRSDSVTGFGDLVPQFALRWNMGVNNFMTYITGDAPVGAYDSKRLANLGIGHGAIDAGGGYTYFDPKTGHEFSAVLGFTYNLENTTTQYQNGVDMHLDMGASQFVTKQLQLGLVGYVYDQLSCDSGSGDRLGCFESRVMGVGPQIGYIFPIGTTLQGYLNVKAYREFDSDHRADGWNAWLTFVISPAAPTPAPVTKPIITK
jgi:hypothetical protein